jgi:pimeloyl-ACP methyl ester carboxylesterase
MATVQALDDASAGRRHATRPTLHEQGRARYPDATGFVERDGVHVFYEVYGSGEPTVVLLPTWSVTHSRSWKLQIPDLARRFRVVAFDPRGNGRSDRPTSPEAYAETEFAADALAVMEATGTERAVLVSLSHSSSSSSLSASRRSTPRSRLTML